MTKIEDLERYERNIKKIKKWMDEPNISESRFAALEDLLKRYNDMKERLKYE